MRHQLKMAAGTVRGRGHEKTGAPCQDMARVVRFGDRKTVAAVLADGAGSCARSHAGAALVTTILPDHLFEHFDRYRRDPDRAGVPILDFLRSQLEALSASEERPLRDYSSTLLFCCMRWKRSKVDHLTGHLGDGMIAMHDGKGVCVLSGPDNGEFANTTVFVTSGAADRRIRISAGRAGRNPGFLLMSDGSAESLYVRRTGAPARACATLFRMLERLPQRKAAVAFDRTLTRFLRERTTDDCSLAMVKAVGMKG